MDLFFFSIDVKGASSGKQFDPSNLECFLWSLDKYTINDESIFRTTKTIDGLIKSIITSIVLLYLLLLMTLRSFLQSELRNRLLLSFDFAKPESSLLQSLW